jgi:hypothetical protein
VILDGVDEKGRQLIRPSNGECNALKEYANNCVTQSNSKKAREDRLKFFNSILKNQDVENNFALKDVLEYLEEIYKIEEIELISFEDYELIDLTKFNNI